MRDRSLIPKTEGYQLVMVAHGHMADGVAWFASPSKGTPVAVPADLLTLDVSTGPAHGQLVVDSGAALKSLKQQTYNHATLTLAGAFSGTSVLTQKWKSQAVKNDTVTEVVELVESTGRFSGILDEDAESGVGVVEFTLSGAKTVDLTRYGMATLDGSFGATGGTMTVVLAGTLHLANPVPNSGGISLSSVSSGSLVFSGTGTLNPSSLSGFTGTLTINTTNGGTVSGLAVDSEGTITQLPTLPNNFRPAKVVIITISGTYTFVVNDAGVLTPAASS